MVYNCVSVTPCHRASTHHQSHFTKNDSQNPAGTGTIKASRFARERQSVLCAYIEGVWSGRRQAYIRFHYGRRYSTYDDRGQQPYSITAARQNLFGFSVVRRTNTTGKRRQKATYVREGNAARILLPVHSCKYGRNQDRPTI